MKSDCDKPIVLYGEGGCGKTSLLAKAAGLTSSDWFCGVKPTIVIRFLGTTPDSSALTPTLMSICQQVIGDQACIPSYVDCIAVLTGILFRFPTTTCFRTKIYLMIWCLSRLTSSTF